MSRLLSRLAPLALSALSLMIMLALVGSVAPSVDAQQRRHRSSSKSDAALIERDGKSAAVDPSGAPGSASTDWAGGFAATGGLGDWVWLDSNENAVQDPGEPGVAGVLVQVAGPSGVFQTMTDGFGHWQVNGLQPGNYTVDFTAPIGYVWVEQNIGTDDIDSDADAAGFAGVHTVVVSAVDNTVDGGLIEENTPTGGLGDLVWLDINLNGIHDENEPGVAGVIVKISGPSGQIDTETDSNGIWLIDGLLPGVYEVKFGFDDNGNQWTIKDAGNDDTVDSDVNSTGNIGYAGAHVVVSNHVNDAVDGGLVP